MLAFKTMLATLTAVVALSTMAQADIDAHRGMLIDKRDDDCGIKDDCMTGDITCAAKCGKEDVGRALRSVCYLDVCFCGFSM
ncbi:hypothetical protein BCR42DRAFT_414401 [Absidia repens]|uniref:Invertebrate defensins family profile domain-containing protein n=1 Tax=Absidia repens TaxID=90262 RepID=A0A1X2IJ37_9FUNG|nr:hypothetical protein BCR42DRAFT_414401 [Absidia repens]